MIEAMTAVWALSEARKSDLLVFLAIANEYNHEYEAAWPSVDRLASLSRLSRRKVQESIQRLVELKELAVDPQAVGPMGRQTNRYRILLPIQTRRVKGKGKRGAESARVGVQSEAGRGAVHDSAYKDHPLRDPLIENASVLPLSYVKKDHHHQKNSGFWCGLNFCIPFQKYLDHSRRVEAAGFDPHDLDWPTWYGELDTEWTELPIADRPPQGPIFWVGGKLTAEIDDLRKALA